MFISEDPAYDHKEFSLTDLCVHPKIASKFESCQHLPSHAARSVFWDGIDPVGESTGLVSPNNLHVL
jgi:hypothetical protein